MKFAMLFLWWFAVTAEATILRPFTGHHSGAFPVVYYSIALLVGLLLIEHGERK